MENNKKEISLKKLKKVACHYYLLINLEILIQIKIYFLYLKCRG